MSHPSAWPYLVQVTKNHFASEFVYHKYADEKTCGVIEVGDRACVASLAAP